MNPYRAKTTVSLWRCDRCHRRLRCEPIRYCGQSLGPRCAVVLGYVPPSPDKPGKATRKPSAPRSRKVAPVRADQPELFAEISPDWQDGPYWIAG